MKHILLLIGIALTSMFSQAQPVKFRAEIANRFSDSVMIAGKRPFKEIIPINKSGVFEKTFEAVPGFYQFSDGNEVTMMYLKPGYDLQLALDTKQFDETVVYKGKGATENNFLAQKALLGEAFEESLSSYTTDEQMTAAIANFKKTLLDRLAVKDMDADFRTLATQMVEGETADLTEMIAEEKKKAAMVGQPSPGFDYENHKGGKTKLSDLKGKYVYVDVWATWCGPCRQEIPYLKEVEKQYHGKKIEFVSLSIDPIKDHQKWKTFVTEKQLGGIQLMADNDWNSDFVTAYGIRGIPRFILIDPKGNVVSADAPRPSDPELKVQLDALLK